MTEDELRAAHKHCTGNKTEIEQSNFCGCFYCRGRFSSVFVDRWMPIENTAFCPVCTIDSVIGDASGLPVEDPAFLAAMHELWFGDTESLAEQKRALAKR